MRQLWNVVQNKHTCWNLWINAKYLKGVSIWDVPMPKHASAGWKGILGLQVLMLPHIQFLVGNGHLIKFWTDPWLNGGRLKDRYGERAIYGLGLGCDIRLHCFIKSHEWLFPTPTSNALMDIFCEIPLEIQPCYDFDDELVWTL